MKCFELITIYRFGSVSIPSGVLEKMGEVFGLEVKVGDRLSLPAAYIQERRQFEASSFLQSLLYVERLDSEVVVGVTEEDLFEDGLNFVFGVALPFQVAVVATARLHNSFYGLPEDDQLFQLRLLKELNHEVGHVIGLPHCPNPTCVMHFSNSLEDTDRKSYMFCDRCKELVKRVICS